MPKALTTLVVLLLIAVTAVLLVLMYPPKTAEAPRDAMATSTSQATTTMVTVSFDAGTIEAEVVQSPEARRRGLSDHSSLASDEGMLFVYEREQYPGIWMKEMAFPIDIIWLDAKQRIVYMKRNAKPDSYPETTYRPDDPAQYVLEVNAGVIDKYGLTEGDTVDFRGEF